LRGFFNAGKNRPKMPFQRAIPQFQVVADRTSC
jgi:hypothetical protein